MLFIFFFLELDFMVFPSASGEEERIADWSTVWALEEEEDRWSEAGGIQAED